MKKTLIFTVIFLLGAGLAAASVEDDPTSLSYISYLERYATVQPADGQENIEATINMPLVTGDRVDLARDARMEIVLADGNTVWLNEYSTLSLDAVALSRDVRADRTVLFLADGSMIIELPPDIPQKHRVRIDSAKHTLYLSAPGVYRIDVLGTGRLWVEVWEGLAAAASPAGEVPLREGSTAEIGDSPIRAVQAHMKDRDSFARWVQSIRGQQTSPDAVHVDTRYARQASQLDSYGTWIHIDETDSWGWQPAVSSGWDPYTSGRWYWTPTGWSWLSYEPWGWLPYHYGSWSYYNSCGWVWGWGSTWSPAWVYWSYWPGYVGWCPVGTYSSWWVGVGWGWGGIYFGGGSYYPGYPAYPGHPAYPVYPGYPGYPGYRPGRGPYTGRPGGMYGVGVSSRRAASASDLILNMEGRASASSLRGRGWSAVPAGNFSSRNLSRSVRPASEFLRAGRGIDKTEAIISAKPLLTDSPRRTRPDAAVRAAFERTGSRSSVDLSRIVARDASIGEAEALRLVRPATARDIVSSARTVRTASTATATTDGSARGAGSSSSTRNASMSYQAQGGEGSSFSPVGRSVRETLPNAYHSTIARSRPGRSSTTGGSSSTGATGSGGSTSIRTGNSGSRLPGRSTSGTTRNIGSSSRSAGRVSSPLQGGSLSGLSSRSSTSSHRASSTQRSVPSNSLKARALPSNTRSQSSDSGTFSSRSTDRPSTGARNSGSIPGRSYAPVVIPGSSYSGRSSSRSYRSSTSRSGSSRSYSSGSRSYSRGPTSGSISRSYPSSRSSIRPSGSSSSHSARPSSRSSSSYGHSSSRSSSSRSSSSMSRSHSSSRSSSSHSSSRSVSSSRSSSRSVSHRR